MRATDVDGMFRDLSKQHASVRFEVADEIGSLQADPIEMGSRITTWPIASSAASCR